MTMKSNRLYPLQGKPPVNYQELAGLGGIFGEVGHHLF